MALKVQRTIEKHGYESLLKVPKKWIYRFPRVFSKSDTNNNRSQMVLLVENMRILSKKQNKKKWKSDAVYPELLDAVYTVTKELKLVDHKTENIPFSRDGRISFIDLEHHTFKLSSKHLGKQLSRKMRRYWESLIE